jgi:hypothetical protein
MLLRGFYGNVLNNIRALVMANDVVVDLTLNRESAAKWLQLRALQPSANDGEAKILRKYFKDFSVRQRVAGRGEYSLSQDIYGVASESVHFTPWGTQYFSAEDLAHPGEYYLQYKPQYHPFRTMFFAILLENTLPHLAGYFLMACKKMWRTRSASVIDLGSRYQTLLEGFEREGPKRRAVLQAYKKAEDRVRAGEDFDLVFSGH